MFPQKRRTRLMAAAAVGSLLALTAACSSGDGGGEANDDGTPSGTLNVLTWRTDLVEDGTFDTYVEEFKKKYPEVTDVKFEAITDYEGEVRIRMNTKDYGDVLLIPDSVTADQLGDVLRAARHRGRAARKYRFGQRASPSRARSYGIADHRQRAGHPSTTRRSGRRPGSPSSRPPRRSSSTSSRRSRTRSAVDPALHQLQGRLAALPVGGLARRGHGRPGRAEQAGADDDPVDRRARSTTSSTRCSTTRSRRASPRRTRPPRTGSAPSA